MMNKVKDCLNYLGSVFIAIARLFFWEAMLFFSGLQQILFTRTEICGIDLRGLPLRCDRDDICDKISYMDKLKCENPDLEIVDEDDLDDILKDIEDNDEGDPE